MKQLDRHQLIKLRRLASNVLYFAHQSNDVETLAFVWVERYIDDTIQQIKQAL
jgi:hypothetical protein